MKNKKQIIIGVVIILVFGFLIFKSQSSPRPASTGTGLHGQAFGTTNNTASNNGTSDSFGNSGIKYAPDFTLTSLSGDTIRLSDFRDKKPVILDFFATWCHNCQRAMPELSRKYPEYKDKLEVIGINLNESQSTVNKFVNKYNIVFPIVLDSSGLASRNYGIRYTNTHVLIKKDGSVLKVIPGDLSQRDLDNLIAS